MDKSAAFLKDSPRQINLWTVRAALALELNEASSGWEAGSKLKELGANDTDDAKVRKVIALLDRKGWLTDKDPTAPWTNSLGMKFVWVPGTDVSFSVWHTRVQDFEAFVKATGHDATAGMLSLKADFSKQRGDSWKSPGFVQGPTHPVCGVNWGDAQGFCKWLTERERTEGKLTAVQSYRLPADWEWSVAVGLDEPRAGTPQGKGGKIKGVYPWGTQWPPPPSGAGNYAGEEAKDADWPTAFKVIEGYRDGHARTSPVGSYNANRFGLYDMGGNLMQWCEDWYNADQNSRILRGGSWDRYLAVILLSSSRHSCSPDSRTYAFGFRCVLVGAGGVR